MSAKLLTKARLKTYCFIAVMLFVTRLSAQDTLVQNVSDTLLLQQDTTLSDTLIVSDSLAADTLELKKSSSAIDARVDYSAQDSIRFDVKTGKVFLFNEADISYENINLRSAYVEIDFEKSLAYAEGIEDSTGKLVGSPVFAEGEQEYKSKSMKYNYKTKKGYILKVFTEDGDGYLHGEVIKKMEDNTINIKNGSYTTCNLEEDPHFEFRFYKSKVIPGEKIITGPAYLTIEQVPTPLFIPFGLFPNQSGQQSGILIPTYGESSNRGFYFENGGYYWALNDYLDLELVGDIYTRGSWAIEPRARYKKRYKYNGNIRLGYAVNKIGNEGSADYQENKDFEIRWTHSQDPKARPNSRFSANVNIVSRQFNRYNPSSTNDFLSNTFQSSVNYETSFNNKYFLNVNASHQQSTQNKTVSMKIPEISFNVTRFYPFRKKNSLSSEQWYENISVTYNMNAVNQIDTYDSLLFKPGFEKDFRNGIEHNLPISSTIKILKYLNLTNSVTFTDRMYFETIRKSYTSDSTYDNNVMLDTISGFRNAVDFSFNSSLTTKLYGMLGFRKGPLRAVRHVLTPTIGFSYRPDFAAEQWGYYEYYYNDASMDDSTRYSIFEDGVYGGPPAERSGRINFSLSNNLEIKVPSKKDTVEGMKKIVLIDNFTLSGNYDLARDSLNWSKIRMSGRTRLWEGMDLTYSSEWDPYVIDTNGNNINKFEWEENRRLLRLNNTTWNLGMRFNLNSDTFKSKAAKEAKEEVEQPPGATDNQFEEYMENQDEYLDWSIPWSLNLNYNMRFSNTYRMKEGERIREEKLVQTMSFSGDLSITPKWKIGFRSGYDFEQGKLSYTSINIYRDLHCWEMRFNWIPMGVRKSWNFSLNVKSSMLQDLKVNKKKDFRDAF
ncbi:MAG: putative LPS assembly protein LptD [Bacteroidota bacterium]|nr:putative LPS assembly protein LptD [Bacteroidota bacterium]